MNETQQKIDGAYMTPSYIVKKMIEFTPEEWFKGNILEPTAGDGNIVLAILDKKVELGMTANEAINTTFANEYDEERFEKLCCRVFEWCKQHDVPTEMTCGMLFNLDVRELELPFDYKVLTNLPFGCWSCSNLPKQIITHLNKPGVYLTKWSTGCNTKFCKSVIKFENIEFPGIVYDCLLWQYDPNVKFDEPQVWIYYPIPMFPKHKLDTNRKGDVLNKLETKGSRTLRKRLKETQNTSCGIWKDQNINHYKDYEDLNCQIYGKWLDAIDTSAIRHMRIPRDILDDFYFEHKGKYETEREETKDD